MNEQQKEFLQFLRLLEENDILKHIIITGSWAEFIYTNSDVLPDYPLTLRTLDIDFLVKNLRRPTTPVSITALAQENGYVFDKDYMLGTTKIFTPLGMEIEFLVAQKGSGTEQVLKTNLGVSAQALRHMEMLINNTITTDFVGIKVQVPLPEAYVLHKMVINKDRTPVKQIKDANSVISLLPYLHMEKFEEIFNSLTKKEKAEVKSFFEKYNSEIKSRISLDDITRIAEFRAKYFSQSSICTKENSHELE